MIYGYIRVSTDKQSVDNQRYEIETYCRNQCIVVEKWVDEVISSKRRIEERKLYVLLKSLKKNDVLIISELSRLGRNLMQIMHILHQCMESDIKVVAIKERYELGDNINSKVLAFAFGLSAEIERNLISQRTREALARKRSEGVKLGRPRGSRSQCSKLLGKEMTIRKMIVSGKSKTEIAKNLKVCRATLRKFIAKKLNSL